MNAAIDPEAQDRDARENEPRRRVLSVLADADDRLLADAWDALDPQPGWSWLRRPECGLVMVRGRIGGGGSPFNLGEVTVTRCAVVLDSGENGFSWTMGRNAEKSRLAAIFDALWQNPERRAEVEARVIAPAVADRIDGDAEAAEQTAATRVDFFTMVRGEDEE